MPDNLGLGTISGLTLLMQDNKNRAVFGKAREGEAELDQGV